MGSFADSPAIPGPTGPLGPAGDQTRQPLPVQRDIASNQNDFALTVEEHAAGFAYFTTTVGNVAITGIIPGPVTANEAQVRTIYNAGPNTLTLMNASGPSSVVHQFAFGADAHLLAGQMCRLLYIGGRWRRPSDG